MLIAPPLETVKNPDGCYDWVRQFTVRHTAKGLST